jgi:hypothetical protein
VPGGLHHVWCCQRKAEAIKGAGGESPDGAPCSQRRRVCEVEGDEREEEERVKVSKCLKQFNVLYLVSYT